MTKLQLSENLRKYTNLEECPVRNVISRFSGKWSILILCILSENGKTRFNSIQKALPDISPKVLTGTLRILEEDSLVQRKIYAEIPPRVEYSLTEKGKTLMPILYDLIEWAMRNGNQTEL